MNVRVFCGLIAFFCVANAVDLSSFLDKISFLNQGTVTSNDVYTFVPQCSLYVEAQNVSQSEWSWAAWGPYNYLYQRNTSTTGTGSQCTPGVMFQNTDLPGNDYLAFEPPVASPLYCQDACCNDTQCVAWVFDNSAPGAFINCTAGNPCCYLKEIIPAQNPNNGLTSGIVYHNMYNHPPSGMRSAVPLGGLGTGSFEIRADGSFHEFTIMNQSPAGSAKQQTLDEAVFGLWTSTGGAVMLRTNPPPVPNSINIYPAVDSMTYSGTFPVSKLAIKDHRLNNINASLFAFSELHIGNFPLSSTPVTVFSLEVENTSPKNVDVAFMFNLPYGKEPDTNRTAILFSESNKFSPKNIKSKAMKSYMSCYEACSVDDECASWSYDGHNCLLMDSVPSSIWTPGAYAGVKGSWTSSSSPSMLTLNRPGNFPASGNITLLGLSDPGIEASFAVGNDLFHDIWTQFSSTGSVGNASIDGQNAIHGAASLKTTLKPRQKKTLTIIFSWYFPNRDFLDEILGNYYTNIYEDSVDVATQVTKRLPTILGDISMYHSLFTNTSLPVFFQDILINSFSHLRNAIFTQDGRWRQWEAFDCNDIDSVHNDMQRQLPYVLFFPELEKNKMKAWAAGQATNGMINEGLGPNPCIYATDYPLDTPGGRVMADVTSMFITEAWQLYSWTGDVGFLQTIYPEVKKAIQWQISAAKQFGIPSYMIDTYDILNLAQYELASFNGFLHLTSMLVCQQLAEAVNDTALLAQCYEAYTYGQTTVMEELWNGKYFAAFNNGTAVMADTLYGQVWAYTLGLGNTVGNDFFLKSHLQAELQHNDSPYGLLVMTGRDQSQVTPMKNTPPPGPEFGPYDSCNGLIGPSTDNVIWMGGSPDWTALNIHLGMNVNQAMGQAQKALDNWRSVLNDMWNIHGLVGGIGYGYDGLPWCTSHYGFHMVLWHIPFAITGQVYDGVADSLIFNPKMEAPFQLPVLIPHNYGLISVDATNTVTLLMTGGSLLRLNYLEVLGTPYENTPVFLEPGQSVSWKLL